MHDLFNAILIAWVIISLPCLILLTWALFSDEIRRAVEWVFDARSRNLCREALRLRKQAEQLRCWRPLSARELDRSAKQMEEEAERIRREKAHG